MLRLVSLVVLLLIMGSATVTVGQKTLKRVKAGTLTDVGSPLKNSAPRFGDGTSASTSGKLILGGAHARYAEDSRCSRRCWKNARP
jgi:hypothetical protein